MGEGMHHCGECLTLYSSKLAATECADLDAADATRQRTWMEDHGA